MRRQAAQQKDGLWAYTTKGQGGSGNFLGSLSGGSGTRTGVEKNARPVQEQGEALRVLLQKVDDASDRESGIQKALEDLGGIKYPARTAVGVAASLCGGRLESAVLSNLVQQSKSTLPEEWVVTREAEIG